MHGWIIIDKPLGPGSTQIVSAVKRALREGGYGKHKVGHGGTLDPLATGVLPVAIGEATKLAGRMLDASKRYDFTIRFGAQTDTLDLEGKVIAESPVRPTFADVAAVLARFTGPIEQVPPIYSALKVDGERAYDLARKGEEVVLATRKVTVFDLQILPAPRGGGPLAPARGGGGAPRNATAVDADTPLHHPADGPQHQVGSSPGRSSAMRGMADLMLRAGEELYEITLSAFVSKGTYIRSLARDIALALGTVGHVTMLRRTKAGPFTLESAISLDKLAELGKGHALEETLLPLGAGLDDIPALSLDPDQAGRLRKGLRLIGFAADDGLGFATLDDVPVALVETFDGETRVVRGFNLE
ncbi:MULTISPECIES: tRNA pseudouridine(55) synthase TruB [unclassified Sphingomonas]|uniref:tRNA pseudouridine(55) synthase TruB n=1 Tax=unclassified Sphingomonas TaxID=196159 RepID=UPI0006F2FABB|nr:MULTISPECIES: tRNA pseudouridine(55) synthase TruB [unclassified Sphingomonas]KQM26537.1 pseudouridine synthase [Sphingomonas sp. Leaf9]KQM42946.1 pseudouridine synthase [Sphingomonas sp. Leaf11]